MANFRAFPAILRQSAPMQDSAAHDRILNALEISAEPFAICALEGVCSLGLGRHPRPTLHYVLGGRGVLSVQGAAPLELAPGRLVLVPASQRHSLSNRGGAQAAGMSRSRFAARFQAAYGQGAMTLLRDLRLARAAQMLTEQRAPVDQVARAVGFQSRSAFSRAFVAMWGTTPSAFRARGDAVAGDQAAERAPKLA